MRILFPFLLFTLYTSVSFSAYILIPMDNTQKNHLKSYGIAYYVLQKQVEMYWLLNYRGGSFMFKHHSSLENECTIRGVSYDIIADVQSTAILQEISGPEVNMDAMKLEKPPAVAVYSPKDRQPWDDAVTLALTYAEIPYTVIYDEEIILGALPLYDWLHLHHEDFTGQFGKFWSGSRGEQWYRDYVKNNEETAHRLGFSKVSQLKLAVAKKIKEFVAGGGFMFAMCAATDAFDIALAAEGVDICQPMFDGDPADPGMQAKLDFSKTFAFKDFLLSTNPTEYEFSTIDATRLRDFIPAKNADFFALFEFSAKWDPVPTMLCQNHERILKGFMGQSTDFHKKYVKPEVVVMGENKSMGTIRYIHGEFGKGTWTFYGGHDPEDYQHLVKDPPTDLNLFPNSPGYRLILNNVLFPAARKKKLKT
ncbi:MAG: asparagine synthetase B [Bacteroidetes bacterium]|nr:asparagine synthetase B [Bacteroidota bacterium]